MFNAHRLYFDCKQCKRSKHMVKFNGTWPLCDECHIPKEDEPINEDWPVIQLPPATSAGAAEGDRDKWYRPMTESSHVKGVKL